jgi:hypothetical protein
MASGLSARLNLSEKGLDATDALGKLYAPQTEEDVNLFAFASRLRSSISSAKSLEIPNQIYGLVNNNIYLPYSEYVEYDNVSELEILLTEEGSFYLSTEDSKPLNYDTFPYILKYRTKFVTNSATFSNENKVWFSRISGYTLDQRTEAETTGAPIKISNSGTLVNVSVQGIGSGYTVKDESGTVVSLPATLTVNVRGIDSGASSGKVEIEVESNGKISRSLTIVNNGSDYYPDEYLEIIPTCLEDDEPVEDKCIRYTGNSLHIDYSSGYPALLKNEKYLYTVKSSDQSGFYLYDDTAQDWVYLGEFYETTQAIPFSSSPSIVLSRSDSISSENLSRLYALNGRSFFFTYTESYEPSESLAFSIRSISESVEQIKSDMPSFAQNIKTFDSESGLGFDVNTFEGKNFQTDYRIIFRDPDGVLDTNLFSFYDLRDQLTSGVSLSGVSIPGIWLFTGEKYQRIFSSDDRPFISVSGKTYLSPIMESTSPNRYCIGTGYQKPGTSLVKGFDTILGTLIQTLSVAPENGGFVFHRTLTPTTVRGQIKSWPLFSYLENGETKDAGILTIQEA